MTDAPKIALVTGANRGLGLETARQLAARGVTVVATSRTERGAEMAEFVISQDGGRAVGLKLDVLDAQDQTAAKDYVEEHFGRLDVLVNNAGVDGDALDMRNTTSQVDMDVLRESFEVHFFHVVSLTQTLLPLLELSPAGRIVNISAVLGSLTLHTQEPDMMKTFAYNSSKTALNAFTVHLADALKNTSVKVFSAHPGWVRTDHGTQYADLDVAEGAKTPVSLALSDTEFDTGGFYFGDQRMPW